MDIHSNSLSQVQHQSLLSLRHLLLKTNTIKLLTAHLKYYSLDISNMVLNTKIYARHSNQLSTKSPLPYNNYAM